MGMPNDLPVQDTTLSDYRKKLKERNKLTRIPDDPQSVVAKTRARKKAAMSAQQRKGRTSTILSGTVG